MKKRPIIFIHVPKTAGTTINHILKNQYKKRFYVDAFNFDESCEAFKNFSKEERDSFQLIQGHSALKLARFVDNPVLITFLRDPVDLVLSDYYYIKRATWNGFHSEVKKMNTLMEFVEFVKEKGYDNLQTRHLSLDSLTDPEREKPKRGEIDQLFEMAKWNLNRIDFVFTTDQFDAAVVTLMKRLNWNKMPLYTKKNRTENRLSVSELDESTRASIEKLNQFDVRLYNLAKERNDYVKEAEKVEEFVSLNAKYQHSNKLMRWVLEHRHRNVNLQN